MPLCACQPLPAARQRFWTSQKLINKGSESRTAPVSLCNRPKHTAHRDLSGATGRAPNPYPRAEISGQSQVPIAKKTLIIGI
jgi:hypothetical protein